MGMFSRVVIFLLMRVSLGRRGLSLLVCRSTKGLHENTGTIESRGGDVPFGDET